MIFDTFSLLLTETIIIALIIIGLHYSIRYFGLGPIFIFLGSIQFFQNLLASSVYNVYFDTIIFSPGSTLLYTSTLFSILLIYHTEKLKKTKGLILGLVFSNIVVSILSYISLQQALLDVNSSNLLFLKNIFKFDIIQFMSGTTLLFFDTIFLIILYEILNYKIRGKLLLKIFLVTSIISLFDGFIFYLINFYDNNHFNNLLIGNLIGKQISVIVFTIATYTYLVAVGKKRRASRPKSILDVFKILNDIY